MILWSYLCIRTGQVFFLQFIYTHVHVQNNPSLSSCFVEDRVAFMTADVNFAAIWNNFMSLSPSKSSNNFYRGWKHRECHDHHSDQPQHDHAANRCHHENVFPLHQSLFTCVRSRVVFDSIDSENHFRVHFPFGQLLTFLIESMYSVSFCEVFDSGTEHPMLFCHVGPRHGRSCFSLSS